MAAMGPANSLDLLELHASSLHDGELNEILKEKDNV
jgi:hypothetical protein